MSILTKPTNYSTPKLITVSKKLIRELDYQESTAKFWIIESTFLIHLLQETQLMVSSLKAKKIKALIGKFDLILEDEIKPLFQKLALLKRSLHKKELDQESFLKKDLFLKNQLEKLQQILQGIKLETYEELSGFSPVQIV